MNERMNEWKAARLSGFVLQSFKKLIILLFHVLQ